MEIDVGNERKFYILIHNLSVMHLSVVSGYGFGFKNTWDNGVFLEN